MELTPTAQGHRRADEIVARLAHVEASPRDGGRIEMIVARPGVDQRRVLEVGELSVEDGLVGDDSATRRGGAPTGDPDVQVAAINVRFLDLVAGARERWPLAGDQLVLDLDLGVDNLVPGQQLRAGSAVLEVSPAPHRGCRKFTDRFGRDAVITANGEHGLRLRLRGIFLRVVVPGTVRVGDTVTKTVPTS